MKPENADRHSDGRDEQTGISPSAAKLKRIMGDSPAPRNLTPYEIELLRKAAQQTAEVAGEAFVGKKDASQREPD